MKTEIFEEAMGELHDRYYEEAAGYLGRQKKTHHRIYTSAMAACAALAVIAGLSLSKASQPGKITPDQPNRPSVSHLPEHNTEYALTPDDTGAPGQTDNTPQPPVRIDRIALNELGAMSDAARINYDTTLYDIAVWDVESAEAYYGKSLIPAYIPQGLTPYGLGGLKITDKSGAMVEDTVYQDYSLIYGYYEDGSPKSIDPENGVFAATGIVIRASKIGLLRDCCYLLPENEVKTTDIGEVAVTFGYRSMSHGPYDPETHEPSGYYDLYVAEFVLDGIEYEIISESLSLEEIVRVTASIIYGEEVAVDLP